MRPKSVCIRFGIITPCSATYFLEVGARVPLKVATKVFLEIEKLLKFRFLDYFSKAETEECDQEDYSVSDKFGIFTPCSARRGCTPLTESSHQTFSKEKAEECAQKKWNDCNKFTMIISCSATYCLEVGARFSLKVATKVYFRDKKSVKIEIFRLLF